MKIGVLDHGYVEFVEEWGTGKAGIADVVEVSNGYDTAAIPADYEVGIIEAARQSTQGSFRGWDSDFKLLAYLYNNKHSTPFEFSGMTIEVQAPIFVFREWHRHRTQSYSEMSARYSPVPSEKYTPTMDRLMMVNEPSSNKQAGNVGGIELTAENAMKWLAKLEHSYAVAEDAYQFGLSVGVAKELARCPMPVANYTRMRATANLRNWLAFLTLRADPAAQHEIRCFANAVALIISKQFPRTYELFCEPSKEQKALQECLKYFQYKADADHSFAEEGSLMAYAYRLTEAAVRARHHHGDTSKPCDGDGCQSK